MNTEYNREFMNRLYHSQPPGVPENFVVIQLPRCGDITVLHVQKNPKNNNEHNLEK